mmetsp:Transcript_38124/g.28078  ORF Transcript_38124/g.28078 Transcript_38124/m.28078 type:complete len:82 (+) Transcript_38124:966-1211(+)
MSFEGDSSSGSTFNYEAFELVIIDMICTFLFAVIITLIKTIKHSGKIKYSTSIIMMMFFNGAISVLTAIILLIFGNLFKTS